MLGDSTTLGEGRGRHEKEERRAAGPWMAGKEENLSVVASTLPPLPLPPPY